MTFEEQIIEVWQNLGEPTDLSPYDASDNFDITSLGARKIAKSLNLGQQAVAFYKNPRTGRQHRWKDGYRYFNLNIEPEEVDCYYPTGTADNVIYLDMLDTNDPADRYFYYDGDLIQILHASFDTNVNRWACTLAESHSLLEDDVNPVSIVLGVNYVTTPSDLNLAEVLKIAVVGGSIIERASRGTDFGLGEQYSEGTPGLWYRRNKRIYFDTVVVEDLYLRSEGVVGPTVMVDSDDEMEISPQLEWAVILWALGWGYGLKQEFDVKTQMQNEFHSFMMMTQTEDDVFFNLDEEEGVELRLL